MSSEHDRLLTAVVELERRTHERGWDRSPTLYVLDRTAGSEPILEDSAIWDGERPSEVLRFIAHATSTLLRDILLEDFAQPWAWVFVHEAWLVKLEGGLDDVLTNELAVEHRLEEHRRRVEIRMAIGVSKSGDEVSIVRQRGEEPKMDRLSMVGGTVIAALRELATVLR